MVRSEQRAFQPLLALRRRVSGSMLTGAVVLALPSLCLFLLSCSGGNVTAPEQAQPPPPPLRDGRPEQPSGTSDDGDVPIADALRDADYAPFAVQSSHTGAILEALDELAAAAGTSRVSLPDGFGGAADFCARVSSGDEVALLVYSVDEPRTICSAISDERDGRTPPLETRGLGRRSLLLYGSAPVSDVELSAQDIANLFSGANESTEYQSLADLTLFGPSEDDSYAYSAAFGRGIVLEEGSLDPASYTPLPSNVDLAELLSESSTALILSGDAAGAPAEYALCLRVDSGCVPASSSQYPWQESFWVVASSADLAELIETILESKEMIAVMEGEGVARE